MPGYSREAEMHARRLGFKSAEEATSFYRSRDVGLKDPNAHGFGGLGEPDTWWDQIKNHKMHPSNMLNYITELFKGATGGN